MRRLLVAAAATIGLVAVFLVTVLAGLWMNVDADCDGVCVDMLGIIGALALVLGVPGALGAGWSALALLDRRRTRRAAPQKTGVSRHTPHTSRSASHISPSVT